MLPNKLLDVNAICEWTRGGKPPAYCKLIAEQPCRSRGRQVPRRVSCTISHFPSILRYTSVTRTVVSSFEPSLRENASGAALTKKKRNNCRGVVSLYQRCGPLATACTKERNMNTVTPHPAIEMPLIHPEFDKQQLPPLLSEFRASTRRAQDKSLATRLEEVLRYERPHIRPDNSSAGEVVQNRWTRLPGRDGSRS